MLNYFVLFRLNLVKEERLPDTGGNTTADDIVFAVTDLDVINVFLQNLPEEISGHCFLINVVSECNKGESEAGFVLQRGWGYAAFYTRDERSGDVLQEGAVSSTLNPANTGVWWKWIVCVRDMCISI